MDEGDEAAVRTGSRSAVDQFEAALAEVFENGREVGDAIGDVMEPGSAPIEEAGDW